MLVNRHSGFLALGLLTYVWVMGDLVVLFMDYKPYQPQYYVFAVAGSHTYQHVGTIS